jgi:hypothetical protein
MVAATESRPWAPGRIALHAHLTRGGDPFRLPDYDVYQAGRETLKVLAATPGLFAADVEPIVEQLTKDVSVSALIVRLVREVSTAPSLTSLVRLYQLVFSDYHYPFAEWDTLRAFFKQPEHATDPVVFDLFSFWAEDAPDRGAVDFSLFVLGKLQQKPSLDVMRALGRSPALTAGAAAAIAVHFDAGTAETPLIELAKAHSGSARTQVLSMLRGVDRPEHRQWLLHEGYDNGLDYEPCAMFAAVHGRLIDVLRQRDADVDALYHSVRMLALMADSAGKSPMVGRWWSINDYADAPEAVGIVIDLAEQLGMPARLHQGLSDILYFLEKGDMPTDDAATPWTHDVSARLAHRLRELLTRPATGVTLWWDKVPPTIDDVRAGDLSVFHEVLMASDGDGLHDLVTWANAYLELNAPDDRRTNRRLELLSQAMPGIRQGGLAGLENADLGSQYGQLLLQLLLRMRDHAPMGEAIVRAGLESDIRFLRSSAARVLAAWPDDSIPSDLVIATRVTRSLEDERVQ